MAYIPNGEYPTKELNEMTASVYIETSVISYLTARPSRDLVIAAHQAITLDWWQNQKSKFEVYISVLVEEEISAGDSLASKLRIEAVTGIPSVAITPQAQELARFLISGNAIPGTNTEDALHIGIAAAQNIEYLLTWNFRHINNPKTKSAIIKIIEQQGLICPILCSPEELGV